MDAVTCRGKENKKLRGGQSSEQDITAPHRYTRQVQQLV